MRLDEWQKFIESQFLDDQAVVPEKPSQPVNAQPVLALDEEPGIDISAPLVAPPSEPETRSAVEAPERKPLPSASLAIAPRETPLPAEKSTAKQIAPPAGFVVRSPQPQTEELPSLPPMQFGSMPEIDTEIPDFASYLPASPSQTEPVRPPQRTLEAVPAEAVVSVETGPVSVLIPMTYGFVSPSQLHRSPTSETSDTESLTSPRRRTRAPQAKNVVPEPATDHLASVDLWSKVPRHVQTLLALERMEEEREVAQASYKRPFQEKRAELIARILNPILSLEDTARLLNVCPTTVRRYTNKGILTHYRKETDRPTESLAERETRQRRFRLSDILAFLESQQTALEQDRQKERVAPSRRKRSSEEALEQRVQE